MAKPIIDRLLRPGNPLVIQYVLGFAFTLEGKVALILKDRPPALAGRWNGIGGKIETGEKQDEAMSREFLEETGVLIPANLWVRQGMVFGPGYEVNVFRTTSDHVKKVRTMESETVTLFYREQVKDLRTADNVNLLIHLSLLNPDPNSPNSPSFVLSF